MTVPTPVVRAEDFYAPPAPLKPDDWKLVPPAELVLRWYEYRFQRRIPTPSAVLLGEVLWARINRNRWVADCPCRSAQVVTPADPRFACPECGAGWMTVRFPDDVAAAEQAVAGLDVADANWWNPADPSAPEPTVPEEPAQ